MHWIIVTEMGDVYRVKDRNQFYAECDKAEMHGCGITSINDYGRPRISNRQARVLAGCPAYA